MPLFYDKAASIAMVKHGMSVQLKAIQFLNPGQIPVTVFDAPLVQWKWQDEHGMWWSAHRNGNVEYFR